MSWSLTRIAAPEKPAVSLDRAKLHLRVEHDAEDALIAGYVEAATGYCEDFQLRSYVEQQWRLTLPRFPKGGRIIRLPRPPLISVDAIAYVDPDGEIITLPPTSYLVDTDSAPGRVHLGAERWPPTARGAMNAVTITYTTGYGEDDEDVPGAIQAAILLMVGSLYEHRESVTVGTGPSFRLPLTVENLLYPQKVWNLDPLGGC